MSTKILDGIILREMLLSGHANLENEKENGDIYAACRCLGIAVYVCGSRSKQDFIIPEIEAIATEP